MHPGITPEECRAALEKLLDAEILFGSRRLSDFCRYCGNAALDGRPELDQYEIAEKVLNRTSDFNPLDDATVRKMATQLRHKLDEYYAGPGQSEPIVISMPRRSYVLRFRRRGEEDAAASPREEDLDLPATKPEPEQQMGAPVSQADVSGTIPWKLGIAGLAVFVVLFFAWQLVWGSRPAGGSRGEMPGKPSPVTIETRRGDLRGKELDIAADAIRMGPTLGEGEDATVRLRFTPEYPTQQAGLMLFYDVDNFIRLGPHYKDRALMEFGVEQEGSYQGRASTYLFDPLGQFGLPRWLTMRRAGHEYSAYVSSDGFDWRALGGNLALADSSGDLKTAIYAFNGRSVNPPARATFEHFGVGLAFHHRHAGPLAISDFPGWGITGQCTTPVSATVTNELLEVGFASEAMGCAWYLLRAAPPAGDWAISTLVDFQAVSGSAFGLTIQGTKANLTISRRDLGGRLLVLERSDDNDLRIPDFSGAPPLVLRMEKRGTSVRASISRDLDTYTILPAEVKLDELGEIKRIGVVASIAHWTSNVSRPPARVYWVRVEPVVPGLMVHGNVP